MDRPEDFLTRQELAQLLRVSLRTIDNIQSRGMPPRPPLLAIKIGRTVRFERAKALEWLRLQAAPVERRGRGRPRKYTPGSK